jgi:hypothetical protein
MIHVDGKQVDSFIKWCGIYRSLTLKVSQQLIPVLYTYTSVLRQVP